MAIRTRSARLLQLALAAMMLMTIAANDVAPDLYCTRWDHSPRTSLAACLWVLLRAEKPPVTTYLIVKWLHVLSSVVLVGTGLGSAFYMFFGNRSGSVAAPGRDHRLVVRRPVHHACRDLSAALRPVVGASRPVGLCDTLASRRPGVDAVAGACWRLLRCGYRFAWPEMAQESVRTGHARLTISTPSTLVEALGYPAFTVSAGDLLSHGGQAHRALTHVAHRKLEFIMPAASCSTHSTTTAGVFGGLARVPHASTTAPLPQRRCHQRQQPGSGLLRPPSMATRIVSYDPPRLAAAAAIRPSLSWCWPDATFRLGQNRPKAYSGTIFRMMTPRRLCRRWTTFYTPAPPPGTFALRQRETAACCHKPTRSAHPPNDHTNRVFGQRRKSC